jgi:hypothetical protein
MPSNTDNPRYVAAVHDGLSVLAADCRDILETDYLRGDPIYRHAEAAHEYLTELRALADPIGERHDVPGWRQALPVLTADKRPDGRDFLAAPRGRCGPSGAWSTRWRTTTRSGPSTVPTVIRAAPGSSATR